MTAPGGVVLDASAAMAWLLREASPDVEAMIDDLVSTGFVLVPELWHAEMANAIRSALRTGRIDEEFVLGVTEQLEQLEQQALSKLRVAAEEHKHDYTN